MLTSPRRLAAALIVVPLGLSACSPADDAAMSGTGSAAPAGAPACPAAPVEVVVSVDQWGDIVGALGGACATVTTVLASSSVDPHDYEPSPSDAARFEGARLVVLNGGHYDEWAAKLAAGSAPDAPVIEALAAGGQEHDHGAQPGINPHAWYSPTAVTAVADAVTAELSELSPDAAPYFAERRTAFTAAMKPYDDTIAAIRAQATGKRYAATESVFDDMAHAVGLVDVTPAGYASASANETDPTPADLDAMLALLDARGADVLVYNTQTEGSVPEQVRAAAEAAGVPVVEVTETVPPGVDSFPAWQVGQLDALAGALGVTV